MAKTYKLPKVTQYVKNVGKSVAYAAIDGVKSNATGISDFLETNADVAKATYAGLKDFKGTMRKVDADIRKSNTYKAIDLGIKNLIDDAKTGNFYRTRINEGEYAESATGIEDFEFSYGDDDSSPSSSDMSNRDLSYSVKDAIGASAASTATAVASGTNLVINSGKANTKLMLTQIGRLEASFTSGMGSIYSVTDRVNQFLNGPMLAHLENSRRYYEESTKLMREQHAMMKEMLEMQQNLYKKQTIDNKPSRLDEALGYGSFDIVGYAKNIKSNITDLLDQTGLGMFTTDMGGATPLMAFAAEPMKLIMQGIVNKIMDKDLKRSIKSFDKGLTSLFSQAAARLNKKRGEYDYSLGGIVAKIFGIDIEDKKTIKTDNIERGAVPFDGIVRQSIIEVIPNYLARIESALTGGQERHYDPKSGRWKTIKEIKKDFKDEKARQIAIANSDVRFDLMPIVQGLAETNKDMAKSFEKRMNAFMEKLYEDGGDFRPNMNKGKRKGKDDMDAYEYYGFKDQKEFDKVMAKLKRDTIRDMAANNMRARQNYSRALRAMELEGGPVRNLFSGAYDTTMDSKGNIKTSIKDFAKTNILTQAVDKYNNNIFFYLREIYNTISQNFKDGRNRAKNNTDGRNTRTFRIKKNSGSSGGSSSSSSDDSDDDPDDLNDEAIPDEVWAKLNKEKEKENAKINEKKRIIGGIREYFGNSKIGGFIDSVLSGAGDLLQKPVEYSIKLLDKADDNLFKLMFGDGAWKKSDGTTADNAFDYIMDRVKTAFDDIKKHIEKIFNPIKDRFKEVFKPLWEKYGQPVKKELGKMGSHAKDRVKKGVSNTYGKAWQSVKDKIKDGNVVSADEIENGEIDSNARGGIVTKRGLTMISPGEIIIPASFDKKEQDKMLALEKRDKKRILKAIGYNASGTVENEQEMKETLSKIYKENKGGYAKNAAGGVVGGAAGLLLGVNPLLGAMAGAGLSILKNSETFQTALFGKEIVGPDGVTMERQGGLIPKKIVNIFKKAAPDMGDFGIAGGIAGLLTPLGPLGGAAVGAGIGLLKNSEGFKKFIFGDGDKDGFISKDKYDAFKKKVKESLPHMTVGAIGGALMGPFGILGNAVMGAGLGLLSTTDTFKNFLGLTKENGKPRRGLLGALERGVLDPAKEKFAEMMEGFKEYTQKHIFEPLKRFWEPVQQMFKNMITNITEGVSNRINDFFEKHIGLPIHDFLQEKIFKPITKTFMNILKAPFKLMKGMVAAPMHMLGSIGDNIRMSQIGKGTARNMSAQERLDFRENHKIRAGMAMSMGRDKMLEQDRMLANMSEEQLEMLRSNAQAGLESEKTLQKRVIDAKSEVGQTVSDFFNFKYENGKLRYDKSTYKEVVKKVERLAKNGDYEGASAAIDSMRGLSKAEKDELKQKIKESSKNADSAIADLERGRMSSAQLDDEISNLIGRKFKGRKDRSKLLKYAEAELKARKASTATAQSPEEAIEENTSEFNELYKEKSETIIDIIKEIKEKLDPIVNGTTNSRNSTRRTSANNSNSDNSANDIGGNILDDSNQNDVVDNFFNRMDQMSNRFSDITDTIMSKASTAIKNITDGAKTLFGGGKELISKGIGFGKNVFNKAKTGAGNLTNFLYKKFISHRDFTPTESAGGGIFNDYMLSMVSPGEIIISPDDIQYNAKGNILNKLKGIGSTAKNKSQGFIQGLVDAVTGKKKEKMVDPVTGMVVTDDPDAKENVENMARHREIEGRDNEILEETKKGNNIFNSIKEGFFGFKKKKDKDDEGGGFLSKLWGGFKKLSGFLGIGGKVVMGAVGVSLFGHMTEWFKTSVYPKLKEFLFGGNGTDSSGNTSNGLVGGIKDALSPVLIGTEENPGLWIKVKNFFSEKFTIVKEWFTAASGGNGFWGFVGDFIIPKLVAGWGLAMENVVTPLTSLIVSKLPSLLAALGKGIINGLTGAIFTKKLPSKRGVTMPDGGSGVVASISSENKTKFSSGANASFSELMSALSGSGGAVSANSGDNAITSDTEESDVDFYSDGSGGPNYKDAGGIGGLLGNKQRTNEIQYDANGDIITEYDRWNTAKSGAGKFAEAGALAFRNGLLTGGKQNALIKWMKNRPIKPRVGLFGKTRTAANWTLKAGGNILGGAESLGGKIQNWATDGGGTIIKNIDDAASVGDFRRNSAGRWIGTDGKYVKKDLVQEALDNGANATGFADDAAEAAGKAAGLWTRAKDMLGNTKAGQAVKSVKDTVVNSAPVQAVKNAKNTVTSAVDNVKSTVTGKIDDAVGVVKDKASSALSNVRDKATSMIDNAASASDDVAKVVAGGSKFFEKVTGLAGTIFKKCKSFISTVMKKPTDIPMIENAIKKIGDKIIKKMGSGIVGKGLKSIVNALGNMPFLNIATYTIDFLWGFNNADTILGVAKGDSYEINVVQKCVCGLVNLISNKFTLGFLPADTIMDIVIEFLFPIFGIDAKELNAARENAEAILDQWNKEHPDETYDNLEDFNNKDKITTKIKNWTKDKFGGAWDKTKEVAGKAWDKTKEVAGKAWDKTKELGGKVWDKAKDYLKYGTITGRTVTAIKGAKDIIGDVKNDDLIRQQLGLDENVEINATDRFSMGAASLIEKLSGGKIDSEQSIKKINGIVVKITDTAEKVWTGVKDTASKAWNTAKDNAKKAASFVNEKLGAVYGMTDENGNPVSMTEGIKLGVGKLKQLISDKWTDIKTKAGEFWNGTKEKIADNWNKTKEAVTGAFNKANEKLGAVLGMTDDEGNPVSLTDGLKAKFSDLKDWASDTWNSMKEKTQEVWGNIKDGASKRWDEMKKSTEKAYGIVNEKLGALFGMVDENGKTLSLTDGIKKNWDTAKKKMSETWTGLKDKVSQTWEGIKNWFSGIGNTLSSTSDDSIAARNAAANGAGKGGFGRGARFGMGGRAYQLDPRISGMDYHGHSIGEAGCGPVAAANVINNIRSGNVSVQDAANYAIKHNYKPTNDGTDPRYMSSILNDYGVETQDIKGSSQIRESLKNGDPVILMGKGNRPDSPYGNNNPHYITAMGYDGNGNIIVDDPYESDYTTHSERDVFNGVMKSTSAKRGYGKRRRFGFSKRPLRLHIPTIVRNGIKRSNNYGHGPSANDIVNQNLGVWSELTEAQMNEWIDSYNKSGSTFTRNGKVFVEAARQTGLDPRYIFAHAALESAFGTSEIMKKKNNYFGIGAFDATPMSSAYTFDNGISGGIIGGAAWIRKNYYDSQYKQTTLNKMRNNNGVHQYATDPQWHTKIATIMAQCPYPNTKATTDVTPVAWNGTAAGAASTSSSSTGTQQSSNPTLLSKFGDLGTAVLKAVYGPESYEAFFGSSTGSTSSGNASSSGGSVSSSEVKKLDGSTVSGKVSDNEHIRKAQIAIANYMYSRERKNSYSQNASQREKQDSGGSDCSSMCSWSYRKGLNNDSLTNSLMGSTLPGWSGYTQSQWNNGQLVDTSKDTNKLQVGDLLFWGSGGQTAHVEMYTGDDTIMGHGSGTGPTEKKLSTYNHSKPYMGGRRYITEDVAKQAGFGKGKLFKFGGAKIGFFGLANKAGISGEPGASSENNTSIFNGAQPAVKSTAVSKSTSSGSSSSNSSSSTATSDDTSAQSTTTASNTSATNFPKYTLTEEQKKDIATCITGETGGNDEVSAKQEASQMANLHEVQYGKTPGDGAGLVKSIHGGWYADASWTRGVTDIAKKAVDDVLIGGMRTLPRYVVEHDTFPMDIQNAKSRDAYKAGDDVANIYGSKYKFYTFFGKDKKGDISGYFQKYYDKYKDDQPYGADAVAGAANASSGAAEQSNPTILTHLSNLGTSVIKATYGNDAYEAFFGSTSSSANSSSSGGSTGTNGSVEKFVSTAVAEDGYKEKASNSQLDDKEGNAGSGNYTKFGQHFGNTGPGWPWCAQFVSWSADKAGIPESNMVRSASCAEFQSFFKKNNRWHDANGYTPKRGDVFLMGANHTGIVTGVDGDKVKTIEGNSSDAVKQRSYSLSGSKITGYGDLGLGSGTGTSGTQGTDGSTKVYGKAPIGKGGFGKGLRSAGNNAMTLSRRPARSYGSSKAPILNNINPTEFIREDNYIATNTSNAVSYEVFLSNIISILMTIADNTALLTAVIELLKTNGINVNKDELDIARTQTREKSEKQLRELVNKSNGNIVNTSKLLNNKNTEYIIAAMKAIASE